MDGGGVDSDKGTGVVLVDVDVPEDALPASPVVDEVDEPEPPVVEPEPPLPEPPLPLAGGGALAMSDGSFFAGFSGFGFSAAGSDSGSTGGAEDASAIATFFLPDFFGAGAAVSVIVGVSPSSVTSGLRTTKLLAAGAAATVVAAASSSLGGAMVVVEVVPHATSETAEKSNATNRADMSPLAYKVNRMAPPSPSSVDCPHSATDPRM